MRVPYAGKVREHLRSAFTAVRRKGLVTKFIALSLAAGALQAQENPDLSSLSVDDLMNVEVTSVSTSEEGHLPEILRNLGQNSVLTVSDIDRFSLRGGVIEFRMVGNRVRFDINREPAIAARLSISSKLLSVARAIHEGRVSR